MLLIMREYYSVRSVMADSRYWRQPDREKAGTIRYRCLSSVKREQLVYRVFHGLTVLESEHQRVVKPLRVRRRVIGQDSFHDLNFGRTDPLFPAPLYQRDHWPVVLGRRLSCPSGA